MHKDLKTGMVFGLILVAIATVWISTRPALTTKARVDRKSSLHPGNTELLEGIITQPVTDSAVEPPYSQPPPQINESHETRFHIVLSGETLSDISYKYYGSANKWQKIYNANRRTIKNPNVLIPGTKIAIPD